MKHIVLLLMFIGCANDSPNPGLLDQGPAWVDTEPMLESDILDAFIDAYRVERIIIHADATRPNSRWGKDELLHFFKEERGWSRPGYTFWIDRQGVVHSLIPNVLDCFVDYAEISNGAKGYNLSSIHIAYKGGANMKGEATDNRTVYQKKALSNLIEVIRNSCPDVEVISHRDLPGVTKACPSFDATSEYFN